MKIGKISRKRKHICGKVNQKIIKFVYLDLITCSVDQPLFNKMSATNENVLLVSEIRPIKKSSTRTLSHLRIMTGVVSRSS